MNIPWYRSLLESADVKRHLFWHSSPLNSTGDFVNDLQHSNSSNHVIKVVDCAELPILPHHDLDVESLKSIEADVFIISNFDLLLNLTHGRTWMRQLRPVMINHLRRGSRLIVASNCPQSHYPAIDGSSLATDCVQHMADRWKLEQLRNHGSEQDMKKLVSLSAGMPGPASEILKLYPDVAKANTKDALGHLKKRITDTMIQCGSDCISWLEAAVLLRGVRTTPYDEIPPQVATTLYASGLGSVDFQTDCLDLMPGVSDTTIRTCVELAERSFLNAPPQWTKIAGSLFKFERTARALLAESAPSAEALLVLLEDHTEKIRRNFTAEYGAPSPDLGSLPNPARWIDLSDLLDLLIHVSQGARVGGLTSKQWNLVKLEVLPIRNKIQHMRLPSEGDRRTIEKHLRAISR